MDILIIDIGCTHSKSIIYRAGKIIDKHVVDTPQDAQGIVDTAKLFVDKAISDGYELSGIIPMSFSESVILEYIDYTLKLYGVYPDVPDVSRPAWEDTGYPYDVFQGVCQILPHIKDTEKDVSRVLPVSATIAVQLTNCIGWKMWDTMHASNTGLYGDGKWLTEVDMLYSDWIYMKHTGSPFRSVVGYYSGIPVLLGGHDQLFAMYPKPFAYISCGTYITASQPSEFMVEVKEGWAKNVRYVQDVNGVYHKQMCMKSRGEIDLDQVMEIRQFLSTDKVVVFGSYAKEMSEVLYDYSFETTILEDQQFIGAGMAAERGVYDRQNLGANVA